MKKSKIDVIILVSLIIFFTYSAFDPHFVTPGRYNYWVFENFGASGFYIYVRIFSATVVLICSFLLYARNKRPSKEMIAKIDSYLEKQRHGNYSNTNDRS